MDEHTCLNFCIRYVSLQFSLTGLPVQTSRFGMIPEVVGILLQLPLTELQQLVAVPKKFQERFHEALAVVGWAGKLVGWLAIRVIYI